MVHIYTFCDKTLVGKIENLSSKFLCENLFKLGFRIDDQNIRCSSFDYSSLKFNKDKKNIYFLLMQKSNATLNSYLAEICECELVQNELLKQALIGFHKFTNVPMDASSELEWTVPSKCTPITNPNGKTQGYVIVYGECEIFVLPNNFLEFEKIYQDCLLGYIKGKYPCEYKSETYRTFGITEENIKLAIADKIKNNDKVSISIFSRGMDNDVVIRAKLDNEKFDEYTRQIYSILSKYIYSAVDMSLDDHLNKLCSELNIKIALVGDKSLSKMLSNLGNEFYDRISLCQILSNKQSIINFGILEQAIEQFGQTSTEIIYDIAVRALTQGDADIVLAEFVDDGRRGISYIAIGNKQKIDIYKNTFIGDDEQITTDVANTALFYLLKKLQSRDFIGVL